MSQTHSQAAFLAAGLRDLADRLQADNSPHYNAAYVLFCQASRMEATVLQGLQMIRLGHINYHGDTYYRETMQNLFGPQNEMAADLSQRPATAENNPTMLNVGTPSP